MRIDWWDEVNSCLRLILLSLVTITWLPIILPSFPPPLTAPSPNAFPAIMTPSLSLTKTSRRMDS